MHRSRPFVLVILAAAAACSRRDPNEGNDILSQDRTLTARLETTTKDTRHPTVPDACGAITLAPAPSAANQQQAEALTQQAGVAELHGDIQKAKSLLRRASALDGTNKSAAYHLGRTSEALGDNGTAMTAYCHYLALAPTAAESAEARQRVAGLTRSMPHATSAAASKVLAPGTLAPVTPAQPARERASTRPRPLKSAPVQQSASARSSARASSPSVTPSGSAQPQPVAPQSPSITAQSDDTHGSATAGGDVVATRAPMPASDPSPAPRTQRRSSIGVQSAIIGAAAGAILGGATGHSVRSAVIGAAAGGVLGTVVGATTTRPMGRNTRTWAR